MDSMEYNDTFLSILESDLGFFDKVILVKDFEEVLQGFQALNCEMETISKVLILSSSENHYTLGNGIEYRKIEQWEECALSELYCMYEFSDRFFVITRENQFGSLFNYVHTGLLTMNEVIEALLR